MQCLNRCAMMREIVYEQVEIDVCAECISVWLDDDELARIVYSPEHAWSPEVVKQVLETTGSMGVPKVEHDRELHCPSCDSLLEPVNYQGNSGVIINTCPNQHGVWLDHGELAKIRIYMDNWKQTKSID